jgi:ubiquinone/menaquinone biosynthesis C-methylase UbiE
MSQQRLTPTHFIHPVTKETLFRVGDGALVLEAQPHRPVCQQRQSVYDFASLTETEGDRPHYDGVYAQDAPRHPVAPWDEWERPWRASPDARQLLASLGELEGKTVLLLGNGMSCKELHFLTLGARCVYTDLSISAVHGARKAFLTSGFAEPYGDRIEFLAVDALHLPFAAASFDLVYGCALVHHLQDLHTFFSEVVRVLKPDGQCRFLDDAYCPTWQFLKRTALHPLQQYTHRKHGISPEDLVATRKGGFTRSEIEQIARDHGFREVLFERSLFFEYFCTRGVSKLGGRFLLPMLQPLCRRADTVLDRCCGLTHKHGVRLVWGFRK